MDVASMEVVTLFDNTKYFKIEFFESVFEDNIEHIQTIIDLSFDMSQDIIIEKPVIKQGEATLDCEHSMTYAELSVYTQNQKGLLAFIVHTLDSLNIDITTAKIYTTKTRARDNFLIDKEQDMCHNSEKLLSLLTS
jgi:[protein-PII] uridylyltransferase